MLVAAVAAAGGVVAVEVSVVVLRCLFSWCSAARSRRRCSFSIANKSKKYVYIYIVIYTSDPPSFDS